MVERSLIQTFEMDILRSIQSIGAHFVNYLRLHLCGVILVNPKQFLEIQLKSHYTEKANEPKYRQKFNIAQPVVTFRTQWNKFMLEEPICD